MYMYIMCNLNMSVYVYIYIYTNKSSMESHPKPSSATFTQPGVKVDLNYGLSDQFHRRTQQTFTPPTN